MKFVADESLDFQIVERLRQDGWDVSYVAEMEPGISDTDVLHLANTREALIITSDRDFGELIFRQHLLSHGIIPVRLAGITPQLKAETVSSAINRHQAELPHSFVVISPALIRIRREL
jgi:predicted nuclease of predicted toxin-antitoxin system